jgi:hypothetical protein
MNANCVFPKARRGPALAPAPSQLRYSPYAE